MTKPIVLAQSIYASVAHRYWRQEWDSAKNTQVYGRDASPEGIGSNLRLELAVQADDESVLTAPLAWLKRQVDHQCLFVEGSPLHRLPSTLENMAHWLADGVFVQGSFHALTVWETERLACVVKPGKPTVQVIFKENNLTLQIEGRIDAESGLAVPRSIVHEAVHGAFEQLKENHNVDLAAWSEKLFLNLQPSVSGLRTLTIDLGRHKSLVVHS